MKIVVTGSLGHIGKPLTEILIKQGHAVTVVSSKPDKRGGIEVLGAAAAIGTVTDAAFVESVFAGADAVYCMIPPDLSKKNQIAYYSGISQNYVKAIDRGGVKRVVHLSSYGADLDRGTGIICAAHHAELILDSLAGVAITHLRPGYFYYNLFNFKNMINKAGFIGANYGGEDRIVLVAPEDIAKAAAEELIRPGTGVDHRYVVSDDRTAADIAKVLGAAIDQPDLQWMTFTDEQARQGMEQQGMPGHLIPVFVELGAAIHSGILRKDYDKHQQLVKNGVRIEDFAKEFAKSFNEI
ncbi:MAG TPA: NAD(P)H-binding protein [Mucilaginibacter sp.]|nr:NAD(P)H-binding protein [Mucilaginibacter sp.]